MISTIFRSDLLIIFAVVCVCYAALSLARPDYWIADYNLAHAEREEGKLTARAAYNIGWLAIDMSCDAAPAFERHGMIRVRTGDSGFEDLEFDYRDMLKDKLEEKPLSPRSWNFSRARARGLVEE